jgi:uncharacterized protein
MPAAVRIGHFLVSSALLWTKGLTLPSAWDTYDRSSASVSESLATYAMKTRTMSLSSDCPAVKRPRCAPLWTVHASLLLCFAQAIPSNASSLATNGNLALVASATTSYVSGHETITALNDGQDPANSNDKSHGAYGNWPRNGTQWVQYDWNQPISTDRIDVYWFDDHGGVRLPKACRLLQWNGTGFVPVQGITDIGLEENKFNTVRFPVITTTRIRLEFDSEGKSSTGLLEWRVYDSGASPNFAPVVHSGADRIVVRSGRTFLAGAIKDDGKPTGNLKVSWVKESGPGKVTFADAAAAVTSARFSAEGNYVLKLTADDGAASGSDTLSVRVDPPPPPRHLRPVEMGPYQIGSTFWLPRLRNTVVNWIPHCIQKIEDPSLPEGGIENFVQAGNKLAGKEAKHIGAPFANAWVYNTLEAMCLALMLDPQGDVEIERSQASMRKTVENWVTTILRAQEPDGYLQTMYTINGIPRWSNKYDHEGYNAGYFMEAAIAHYEATEGTDTRMVDAARRLADCWVNNIGPSPKHSWYEGHQELEQALVRFARFSEEHNGRGSGRKYIELAKFLLDSRGQGEEYDQSHLPVTQQYSAVGHAVRAVYSYSGMADVAMETGDLDYQSATKSIWNNLINRKYYLTGGVGSGETSEGFGKDYSLPNRSYCESCAGCGELFFQHKMQLIYGDARYSDLCEETLFNAILGSLDLEGENFTYTNPLDSSEHRYKWHGCPCCVGNIPRTLLRLPTWMYSKSANSLCANLYLDSTVNVGSIAGTKVTVRQLTAYPRDGQIALVLTPEKPVRFSLKLRVPDHTTSQLYTNSPSASGVVSVSVNGTPVKAAVHEGYVTVDRKWKAGDEVRLLLPLTVQRVFPSDRIQSTKGRVALRYGPMIYNLESVDQDLESILPNDAPLTAEWNPDLLGGITVIHGKFADGSAMTAIPNYARLNRGGRSVVWIKAGNDPQAKP